MPGFKSRKGIIAENILEFIDEINYNVWDIGPGMATTEDLLIELKSRGYNVPKEIDKHFLGRILNNNPFFL